MKKRKIEKNIMDRIVRYEERHIYRVLEVLMVILLGFLALFTIVLVDAIGDISTTGTAEMIGMLINDWDLAKEYGEVIWETIKYDLPWFKITETVFLFFIVLLISEYLYRRFQVSRKKLQEMKKYLDDFEK